MNRVGLFAMLQISIGLLFASGATVDGNLHDMVSTEGECLLQRKVAKEVEEAKLHKTVETQN